MTDPQTAERVRELIQADQDRRETAALALVQAQAAQKDAAARLSEAQRHYATAWDKALAAGWNAADLKQLRLTAPEAPRRRRRRSSESSDGN